MINSQAPNIPLIEYIQILYRSGKCARKPFWKSDTICKDAVH